MIDWAIHGHEIANCNCNPGCPCQFSQLPTDGTCEAMMTYRIDSGHYGDVKLDGLHAGCLYKWPGPVHEGNGQMQMIVDSRATPEQRAALEAIMTGQDTAEFATMFFVFSAMSPTRHPTISADISMEYDGKSGTGKATVDGVGEIEVHPIPNIVSGDPHFVSIALPHGFEYRRAVMAAGSTRTQDTAIQLEKNSGTHAHVCELHLTGQGVQEVA